MIQKKIPILFLTIGMVIWNDSCLRSTRYKSELSDKKNEDLEKPAIVKENMVVFIALSQYDADLISKKDPEFKFIYPDIISDFVDYSAEISKILDEIGIQHAFNVKRQVWFQYPNGKIKKMRFDPEKVYGMALFARGKKPKLVTAFGAHIEPMAKIISEYFGVEIR